MANGTALKEDHTFIMGQPIKEHMNGQPTKYTTHSIVNVMSKGNLDYDISRYNVIDWAHIFVLKEHDSLFVIAMHT